MRKTYVISSNLDITSRTLSNVKAIAYQSGRSSSKKTEFHSVSVLDRFACEQLLSVVDH